MTPTVIAVDCFLAAAEDRKVRLCLFRALKGDAMRLCAVVLTFLIIAVSGCAHFQDKPLLPSENLNAFEYRRLESEDLKTYIQSKDDNKEWPLKAWGLSNLTLAAFFYHPSLDVARAQYAVSKGNLKTAGQLPNPTFSINPGYNSSTPSGSGISSHILDAALEIPFETAGKRGYRIAQADQLSESARLKIAAAAWQVRSGVRQAFLDIYAARRTEELLSKQQAIQSENVRLLQLQQEAGEVSPFEVSQARITFNNATLALIEAQRDQALAVAKLANAMGVPVSALKSVVFSFDCVTAIPENIPEQEVRRQAMVSRSDLLGALADYQVSQSALQLEIAKQYPDVNLGPGYSYDQGEDKWFLGFSIALPILNHNEGAIAAAEARRSESAAKFSQLQAEIISQITVALTDYQNSIKKLNTAESLTEELKKKAQAVRQMYEAGEILRLAVLSSELELSSGEVATLAAEIETLKALGNLEDAIQQDLETPSWQDIVLK